MLSSSFLNCRGVEQWLARWAHNPKVVGSSPTPANFLRGVFNHRVFGGIAQLVRAAES